MYGQKESAITTHLGAAIQTQPPPPQPEMVNLIHRMAETAADLGHVVQQATSALDRLHGPVPSAVPARDIAHTPPDTLLYALEHHLAVIRSGLDDLRSVRDRLYGLVGA